jgi:hypothetical protein
VKSHGRTGAASVLLSLVMGGQPMATAAQESMGTAVLHPSPGTVLAGAAVGGVLVAAGGALVGLAISGGETGGYDGAGVGLFAAAGWTIGVPLGAKRWMERDGFRVSTGSLIAVSIGGAGLGVLAILAVDEWGDPGDAHLNLEDPRYWDCIEAPSGSRSCIPLGNHSGPPDWAYVAAGVGVHLATFALIGRLAGSKSATPQVALYPTLAPGRLGMAARITTR